MAGVTNREFWDFRVKTRAQFAKLAEQIANIDTSGGGGISELTSKMVVDALGYTPYNATNPANYITSAALAPYALTSQIPTSLPASDVYDWAKAETKPTYTAAEVGALSLSGGALSGNQDYLLALSTTTDNSYILFRANRLIKATAGYYNGLACIANETTNARIGVDDSGVPQYWDSYTGINKYTLLHSGNIGNYNAGSATKLQTARTLWGQSFDGTNNISLGLTIDGYKGTGTVSKISDLGDKGLVVSIDDQRNNWGLAFWTEGNGKGYIQQQGFSTATTYALCLQPFGGNVGIGTTNPSELLDVSGNILASGNVKATSITIGSITLTCDSNGTLVVNGNMYGTGSITAKKSS